MGFDLFLLALFFIALLVGFMRGAVAQAKGLFSQGGALFAFGCALTPFLGVLLHAPLFVKKGPGLGWLVLVLSALLLTAFVLAGHQLGRLVAKGLDLFLAERVYRFMGALLAMGNLWLTLNGLQLTLVLLFPGWALDSSSAFQQLVLAGARLVLARA